MHLAKRVWKQRNAALNLYKPNALARGCLCQKGEELLFNSPIGTDRLTSDLLQPSTVMLKPPFSSFSYFSLPTSKANSLGCRPFSWPLLASFRRVWLYPEVLILVLAIHFSPVIFAYASIVLATALAAMGHRPTCLQRRATQAAGRRLHSQGRNQCQWYQAGALQCPPDAHLQKCSTSFMGLRLLRSATPSRDFKK